MIKDDICVVFRETTIVTPPLNAPTITKEQFPPIGTDPYACHFGQEQGTFIQGNPSATITTKLVLFFDNINVNIKNGDIVQINNGSKYIAENVYKPLNKITKCNLTIKDEV